MASRESEFGGGDSTPSGVMPKSPDALAAHERLRLIYETGSEDPTAPTDDHITWQGLIPGETQ